MNKFLAAVVLMSSLAVVRAGRNRSFVTELESIGLKTIVVLDDEVQEKFTTGLIVKEKEDFSKNGRMVHWFFPGANITDLVEPDAEVFFNSLPSFSKEFVDTDTYKSLQKATEKIGACVESGATRPAVGDNFFYHVVAFKKVPV